VQWFGVAIVVAVVAVVYFLSLRLQSRGMSASAGAQELAMKMSARADDGLAAPPFSTLVPPPSEPDPESNGSADPDRTSP